VERAFQVDLRGIVDLLSHHLYSSPRVYVRELLQNAVDAITARRGIDPAAPASIRLEPPELTGDGTLRVTDTGVGLTYDEVHQLLATIGRSSKRDELGFARHEFLGQFGIGLLSCFLIADQIRVLTRSARDPDAPTVEWWGSADGRYRVDIVDSPRPEPGTTVTLIPRPGAEQWTQTQTVIELARLYGTLLPVDVTVGDERITVAQPPWQAAYPTPQDRHDALSRYARELFGFTPLDIVDLTVPEAGLSGVAFVLPTPTNPAGRGGHRVYLKRMLLAESTEGLLPEWAFFVRCVVDATELRPTASREALYEDDLLESTRRAIGAQLRDWLMRLATADPTRMRSFLEVHHLGVKAMALHDDDMLRLVDTWLPFETSAGTMSLSEFRRRFDKIYYVPSVDEFRQLSAVAGAQGVGLVNAGYTYDIEILGRLPAIDPDIRVTPLNPGELATHFDVVDPATELALRPFLAIAQDALERLDCEVVVRQFDPASLPALYLIDREARHAAELRATREMVDDLWADVLSAFEDQTAATRPQLVLNHRNPLTRRIMGLTDTRLVKLAVEALYGQALLLGHHPLRPADTALLNRSFLGLLDWATHERGSDGEER